MSEITDLTCYQRNRDVVLNKVKDYYKITKKVKRTDERQIQKLILKEIRMKKRVREE